MMTGRGRWLVFGLTGLQSVHAPAETVMISAEGTSDRNFRVQIAREIEATPFARAWLKSRSPQSARERLTDLLTHAESALLKDGLDEARLQMELVFAARLESDWDTKAIEKLRHAALRRAQLSLNENDRLVWLERAARLQSPNPPDSVLLPPPIIRDYMLMTTKVPIDRLNLIERFPWADYLLVDGRVFEIEKRVDVMKDELTHRFTLVSNRYAPVTEILTWSGLESWTPKPRPLVDGSCHSPIWHRETERFEDRKVVWSVPCQSPSAEDGSLQKSHFDSSESFGEFLDKGHIVKTARSNSAAISSPKSELQWTKPQKPIEKKPSALRPQPWFWLGLGFAATYIAVSTLKRSDPSPRPNETDGF